MKKGNNYNITCCKCHMIMDTDDVEYNYSGNENLWLYCESCKISGRTEIRFGAIYKTDYTKEDEDIETIYGGAD